MLLVTGGAGFIGANFVLSSLAATGEPLVNLDKLIYAGNLRNLQALRGDARHVFEMALWGPTTVAIHNHRDMARQRFFQNLFPPMSVHNLCRPPKAVEPFAWERQEN